MWGVNKIQTFAIGHILISLTFKWSVGCWKYKSTGYVSTTDEKEQKYEQYGSWTRSRYNFN